MLGRSVLATGDGRSRPPQEKPVPSSHDALVAELKRFAGANLVYANLDADWLNRMREALAR